MKNCLVIIDVQNGFMSNRETIEIPTKIEKLISKYKFDHIVATQFINKKGSPYDLLMGWRGLMDDESRKLSPTIENLQKEFLRKRYIHASHMNF